MFGKKWEKARALIVEARTRRGGRDTFVHEFVADVTTASGETFRTTLEGPPFSPDLLEPDVRDVVGESSTPRAARCASTRPCGGPPARGSQHRYNS